MKHVVIISGTNGIGAGIASTLGQKGWTVTATGIGADEVADHISQMPEMTAVQLDVRDTDAAMVVLHRN